MPASDRAAGDIEPYMICEAINGLLDMTESRRMLLTAPNTDEFYACACEDMTSDRRVRPRGLNPPCGCTLARVIAWHLADLVGGPLGADRPGCTRAQSSRFPPPGKPQKHSYGTLSFCFIYNPKLRLCFLPSQALHDDHYYEAPDSIS